MSRLKSLSVNEDERGYRLVVLRPPKGPEGNSKGFLHYVRRQWTGPPLNQPQMMASAGGSGVTVVTPSPSASSLLPPSSSSSYTSAAGGQSSPSPANTPPKKTCKSRLYLHIWMFIHELVFLGQFREMELIKYSMVHSFRWRHFYGIYIGSPFSLLIPTDVIVSSLISAFAAGLHSAYSSASSSANPSPNCSPHANAILNGHCY